MQKATNTPTLSASSVQQREDGYINATALCRAGGKRFNDYSRIDTTKAFLGALSSDMGIAISGKTGIPALVNSQHGGSAKTRGTWVHPQVAIHLAQWISPQFAVLVSRVIFDWMSHGGQRARDGGGESPSLRGIPNADPFTRFASERLIRIHGARLSNMALTRSYAAWAAAQGLPPLSNRALDAAMRAAGLHAIRSDGKCWVDVDLRPKETSTLPAKPPVKGISSTAPKAAYLHYLANNLRRAADMAQEIDAPLDAEPCWQWIMVRLGDCEGLDPGLHFEILADVTGLSHEQRRQTLQAYSIKGGAT